jgi:hypothetical protein
MTLFGASSASPSWTALSFSAVSVFRPPNYFVVPLFVFVTDKLALLVKPVLLVQTYRARIISHHGEENAFQIEVARMAHDIRYQLFTNFSALNLISHYHPELGLGRLQLPNESPTDDIRLVQRDQIKLSGYINRVCCDDFNEVGDSSLFSQRFEVPYRFHTAIIVKAHQSVGISGLDSPQLKSSWIEHHAVQLLSIQLCDDIVKLRKVTAFS